MTMQMKRERENGGQKHFLSTAAAPLVRFIILNRGDFSLYVLFHT